MERAIWKNKEYYAVGVATNKALEDMVRRVSGKELICPDPDCNSKILRYCHGDKLNYFAHLHAGNCAYGEFDRLKTKLIKKIQRLLYNHFKSRGYDVALDRRIDKRHYVHILLSNQENQIALGIGTQNTLWEQVEEIEKSCKEAHVKLQWIVVSDNSNHSRETELSYLKRHSLNLSDLIIINRNGTTVTQLRWDTATYPENNPTIQYKEIYSEQGELDSLLLYGDSVGLLKFNERYLKWLSEKHAYVQTITTKTDEKNDSDKVVVEKTLSEMDKWFRPQVVEEECEFDVPKEIGIKLRKQLGPIYYNGKQWLLCKCCTKVKPISEFSSKGRNESMGCCLRCCFKS